MLSSLNSAVGRESRSQNPSKKPSGNCMNMIALTRRETHHTNAHPERWREREKGGCNIEHWQKTKTFINVTKERDHRWGWLYSHLWSGFVFLLCVAAKSDRACKSNKLKILSWLLPTEMRPEITKHSCISKRVQSNLTGEYAGLDYAKVKCNSPLRSGIFRLTLALPRALTGAILHRRYPTGCWYRCLPLRRQQCSGELSSVTNYETSFVYAGLEPRPRIPGQKI